MKERINMKKIHFLEDPITTEIIRNALISIANEMVESLFRSAYSPIIYEMKDCAVALFNENFEILGQTVGVPIFLGSLGDTIKIATKYYGDINYYREGDVYLLNDSYLTGTHLQDVTVFSPIFYREKLVGFAANTANWLDIGAKSPGTPINSINIFQEGIRIGPLKIIDRGEMRKDLFDTICMNSRFPVNAMGDFNAQISACKTGEKRLIEIIEKIGIDTLKRATHDINIQSEIIEREIVSKLPEGIYMAEGYLDNDGITDKPIIVKVKVTIKNGEMYIDLSGSNKMVEGGINCGFAATEAACRMAYKMIVQPDAAVTGGSFKILHVSAPKGSIFNAQEPAACAFFFSPLGLLIDLIIKSFEDVIPDRVAGAHYGDSMCFYLSGINSSTGKLYLYDEPTVGGWGGNIKNDGQDCLINVVNGDFRNLPVEIIESHYPIKVTQYKIRPDSGGPGKNRGGMGVIKEYEIMDKSSLYLWFERSKLPAWGIQGGKSGQPPKVVVRDVFGEKKSELLKTSDFHLGKGWKVTIYTGGGGGYGDPCVREPERVLEDYINGYISREHAQKEYRVVITDSATIDYEATKKLRSLL